MPLSEVGECAHFHSFVSEQNYSKAVEFST